MIYWKITVKKLIHFVCNDNAIREYLWRDSIHFNNEGTPILCWMILIFAIFTDDNTTAYVCDVTLESVLENLEDNSELAVLSSE